MIDELQPFQQFNAGHSAHADIQHRYIDFVFLRQLDGSGAIAGKEQLVIVLEDHLQRLPRAFFIIHDQQGGLAHGASRFSIRTLIQF